MTRLSGRWRLFVLVSSFLYFCWLRLSWSISFWVHVKLFYCIVSYDWESADSDWLKKNKKKKKIFAAHATVTVKQSQVYRKLWGQHAGHPNTYNFLIIIDRMAWNLCCLLVADCGCNGHAAVCHYDKVARHGVCDSCVNMTSGDKCQFCVDFYRVNPLRNTSACSDTGRWIC